MQTKIYDRLNTHSPTYKANLSWTRKSRTWVNVLCWTWIQTL